MQREARVERYFAMPQCVGAACVAKCRHIAVSALHFAAQVAARAARRSRLMLRAMRAGETSHAVAHRRRPVAERARMFVRDQE